MAIKCNPNTHVSYTAKKSADINKEKDIILFNEGEAFSTTQKTIVDETEKIIKELFEPICKKYNSEYNYNTICNWLKIFNLEIKDADTNKLKEIAKCIDQAFEEHYDKATKTLDLTNALNTAKIYNTAISSGKSTEDLKKESQKDITSIVSEQYSKTHDGKKANINTLSADEKEKYIKEYFESKLKEYLSNPNTKDNAYNVLLTDFMILINKTSDSEKKLLLKTAMEVFKSSDAVSHLLQSFQNDSLRTECADSLDFEYLKEINNKEKTAIVTGYFSKPNFVKYLKEINENFRIFYDANKDVIDRLCCGEKPQNKEEEKIQSELNKYLNLSAGLTIGASYNKNLTKEEQKEYAKNINDAVKQYPIYNKYLESLAEYVLQKQTAQDIPVDKLKELLNEITDNKFSEELNKLSEKSATDETGKFKTASEEVIAKSEEKIQAIKQSIEAASTPEQIFIETKNNKEKTTASSGTNIIDYETISGDDGVNIIKDIFTGKVKVSEYLEQVAIKKYKLMNTAMQGNILLNATGEFFNDLVQTLETSTFEHLLSIGWKGRSYDATQKVKDEVEERRDNVA